MHPAHAAVALARRRQPDALDEEHVQAAVAPGPVSEREAIVGCLDAGAPDHWDDVLHDQIHIEGRELAVGSPNRRQDSILADDGPGFRTLDLSLVRQFSLPRSHRLEARIEAFNALNWFIPGNPNTVLSSATFGRITSFSGGADPRVMQFAVKYVF
jgi:hypothetical protein